MSLGQQIQQLQDSTPSWANWVVIVGGAAASWLAPIASLVAIVWGVLQIYGWIVNKGWRPKKGKS